MAAHAGEVRRSPEHPKNSGAGQREVHSRQRFGEAHGAHAGGGEGAVHERLQVEAAGLQVRQRLLLLDHLRVSVLRADFKFRRFGRK